MDILSRSRDEYDGNGILMQTAEDRLRRLARWGLTVVGMGAAALAYASEVEATWLQVTRRTLVLPRLPRALDGMRVAHLTDFHRSQLVPREYLDRCVAAAMAERPDLILLTGDFVSTRRCNVPDVQELLRPLHARLGVYAVLGNHDACAGADRVTAAVEGSGARMLRNRHERVTVDGTEIWVAGVDCPHHEQYRVADGRRARWSQVYRRFLDSALGGIPAGGFRILLAHTPDVIRDAARRGVDLMLSGHTHGGQVRLPLLGATVVPSRYGHRYAAGQFQVDGTTLYVSRGLGTVRFRVRFLCRPELAIFTLRSGTDSCAASASFDIKSSARLRSDA
jgi:predicted MPP superfamily phosphohydrolase